VIANVDVLIIGKDFLSHHDLLVDSRINALIDRRTLLKALAEPIDAECILSVVTVGENNRFSSILREYMDLTVLNSNRKPTDSKVLHFITTNGAPVFARSRRLTGEKLDAARKEFEYLVEQGICRLSKSNWVRPLHLVRKANGDCRHCGIYRAFNAITKPEWYPIPFIQDMTNNLFGKKVFFLQRAYHQIPVNPDDIPKTAVITPLSLFEFMHMTFGLRNATQTFQRLIYEAVSYELDFLFVYINEILIASNNAEEHERRIRLVFERLRKSSLAINAGKCQFGKACVNFLGHKVSADGLLRLAAKVENI